MEEFKEFEDVMQARNRRDYSPLNAIIDRLRQQMEKPLVDIDPEIFRAARAELLILSTEVDYLEIIKGDPKKPLAFIVGDY